MTKAELKKLAIEEVADLMKKYVEYVDSIKDKPFTSEIRGELQTKGNIIRWMQNGLESGHYEG